MSCVQCRPWWRTFWLVKVLLGSLCTVMSISLLRHFWEYVWIRLYWRARLSIISSEYTVHYALWISKIIHGVQDLSSQMSAMLFSSVHSPLWLVQTHISLRTNSKHQKKEACINKYRVISTPQHLLVVVCFIISSNLNYIRSISVCWLKSSTTHLLDTTH